MIPSTLCTLLAVLSSLAAANGVVVQRDGTPTRQPTLQGSGSSSTPTTTTASSSTTPTSTHILTTSAIPTTSTVTLIPTSTQSSGNTTTTPTASSTIPVTASLTSTATATATASATSTPAAGTVNCNGAQQWQAAFAYSAGNQTIFNNQLFTAKQWTYNNAPPMHPDQWTLVGTCSQPINNQVNCSGVAAWQSTVAYTAGNRVTNNGHLWSAVQWVQSNAPNDASGSWQDLGACA